MKFKQEIQVNIKTLLETIVPETFDVEHMKSIPAVISPTGVELHQHQCYRFNLDKNGFFKMQIEANSKELYAEAVCDIVKRIGIRNIELIHHSSASSVMPGMAFFEGSPSLHEPECSFVIHSKVDRSHADIHVGDLDNSVLNDTCMMVSRSIAVLHGHNGHCVQVQNFTSKSLEESWEAEVAKLENLTH